MIRTPDYWTARLLDAHRRQGSACRDRGAWFYLLQADEP